jgi:hypothetical protein
MGPNHKSKGHKGRPTSPTPWTVGQTLSRLGLRLDGYAPMSVYKSIPCSKIGGDREEWPAGDVDGRLAIHQLQTDSIMLMEDQLDLYIRILSVEFRTHHTILVVHHL